MKTYRAAVIGCSRMGGFIDNEVIGYPGHVAPYSHAAGFYACPRTDLVACADVRTDVMEQFGLRYDIPKSRQYTDYREMIAKEGLDIVSVATQPEPRAEIVIYAVDHGVKAVYAEKALTASLAEADAHILLGHHEAHGHGQRQQKEQADQQELLWVAEHARRRAGAAARSCRAGARDRRAWCRSRRSPRRHTAPGRRPWRGR